MELPATWTAYLDILSGKERHEIRRKLRRLERAGSVTLRVLGKKEAVATAMDTFVMLFRSNTGEKARFMTDKTERFFRSLADSMAEAGLLRLLFVDLDGVPVASTMCFDYRSTFYLYNNGYDMRYAHLSLGLLSKVFTIREALLSGSRRFNFLRGSEPYKRRLGGSPVALLECEVSLT
jgi:CelD/BcsL family acetyltransferase involved in cellulose biosynthesis